MFLFMQAILIVLAAGVGYFAGRFVQERKTRGMVCRSHDIPQNEPDTPDIAVDTLISDLRRRALAYAIYRELIKSAVTPEQKQKLYETYSYVNLPPKLEDNAIFASHAELMSSPKLLVDLNEWIVKNGGEAQPSFFAASETAGRLLVETQKENARRIVSDASTRQTPEP